MFIHSNKNLDLYFDYLIDQKGFIQAIESSANLEQLKGAVEEMFNSIVPSKEELTGKFGDYMTEQNKRTPLYDIFASDMVTKLKNSLYEIFSFHHWFMDMRDDTNELQKLIKKNIQDLGIKTAS